VIDEYGAMIKLQLTGENTKKNLPQLFYLQEIVLPIISNNMKTIKFCMTNVQLEERRLLSPEI
jgi:hypothetical protein